MKIKALGAATILGSVSFFSASSAFSETELDVYKSPTCGCCAAWIDHVAASGFDIHAHDTSDLNRIKLEQGIQPEVQSCHTAVSKDGYVFEGHVPAKFITRFLQDTPEGALGLSTPGMPAGSPGMEMGSRFDPYSVVIMFKDGRLEQYESVTDQSSQY